MKLETCSSHDFFVRFSNESTPAVMLSPYVNETQPGQIGMAVAYGVLFALGVSANFWTLVVVGSVMKEKNNDAPKNLQIYIFALCCSDLVILSSLILLISDLVAGYWVVGSITLCHVYLFSETLNKFFGPFILAALSGTCCVSVCRPIRQSSSSNGDCVVAIVVVAFCVLFVVALSTPMYIYGDVYYLIIHNNTTFYYLPKCAFQPPEHVLLAFNIYNFVLGYAFPSLLFTFFYSTLVCFLGFRSRSVQFDNSTYFWKVLKTASGLVVFYLSCWTPYYIMILYSFFNPLSDTSGSNVVTYFSYVIHLLPYINCAGYPILYTLLNRNIKNAYRRVKQRRVLKGNNLFSRCSSAQFESGTKSSKASRVCSSTTLNSATVTTYNGKETSKLQRSCSASALKNGSTTPISGFYLESPKINEKVRKNHSGHQLKTNDTCTTFERSLWTEYNSCSHD